ncbi:MAG: sodium-independent anion transporter [Betaproteobacteria bacterium RIFCSPLOWO2_12_FULL_62_13]|nr:MAG: sodium-independent anion transporter [Betaproteobacteria bacterium RIFCSPLOWO2_12_FULL_62_13]
MTKFFPFLRWRRHLTRETLRADALAGLVGAAIVLPQAVAFATLAGVPPQYGLYAAMVPAIVAALFGSSWHLVSGPTNVISIFVFASLSPLAVPGSPEYIRLVLTLTFLTGVMQLAMGLARMGALVNFISHTVVISFTAGAACLIFAAQITNFFGVDLGHGASFSDTLVEFILNLDDINPYVTAVGAVTLLSGIAARRYVPKFPYMIAAMLVGSVFAVLLDAVFGAEVTRIETVGALPAALPPLSAPDLSLGALRNTLPVALAVTILALTEAVSIARAIAVRSGQHIDANQEFIGQGLSNVCGSFFSAYASSGSFNRSGANYEAGARTPLAAVFSALLLVVIVLAVGPLVAYLPLAVMGAILFMVAYGLFDLGHMRNIARTSRQETVVMLVTFCAAVFADLEFAIYGGVLLSLLLYLTRTSRPLMLDVKPDPAPESYHFTADSSLPDCPQLKMVRINGSIFFGAVDHVQRHLEQIDELNPQQKHVLIVASGINFIDIAGAEMLAQEARRRRRMGGGLYFYRLKDTARALLDKGGYMAEIGAENVFPVKTRAVAAIYPRLDSGICRTCPARIFRECRIALPNGEPVQVAEKQGTG